MDKVRSAMHWREVIPMDANSDQQAPLLELCNASKAVVQGVQQVSIAFKNLSLRVSEGERLGVFSVNGFEAKALIGCLSGVEPLDSGTLEQRATVSWPLGTNDAFSSKLSGYVNARFAAEVYSQSAGIEDDLRLIQDLAGVDDHVYHQPLGDWSGDQKDALKLAVSLAFDFDVIAVGRISGWDHRDAHPQAARIRQFFERRIEGRAMVMCGSGQKGMVLDYCDEAIALVNGDIVFRGDPECCRELVKEESRRQRAEVRRETSDLLAAMNEDLA